MKLEQRANEAHEHSLLIIRKKKEMAKNGLELGRLLYLFNKDEK
ncbi:hypothetical protein LCGC14_2445860, partial [marine sediment metagenome]